MAKKVKYVKKDKVYTVKTRHLNMKMWTLCLFIPAMLLLLFGVACITNSISKKTSEHEVTYQEKGNVDYKVYLKENNYYDEKFLGKDMQYIATLINSINVDFNYGIHASDDLNYQYGYKILASTRVTDKTDHSKILYQKDDVLVEKKAESLTDENLTIREDVDIDYDKYNQYVNAFRRDYGLTANSELVLTMELDVKGNYNEEHIKTNPNLEIVIPLSEQTIDISMSSSEINQEGAIQKEKKTVIENMILFIAGIVLTALGFGLFVFAVYVYLTRFSNDLYQKELHKILKEYDTYIVNAKSTIREDKDLIRVESFTELLDARNLEDKPILFYEVEPRNKAYFVVNGANTIYRFTLTRAYQERKLMEKKN